MFIIDESLLQAIKTKIEMSNINFDSIEVCYQKGDCSCSGGCGTYRPACASCGYQY